MGDPKRIRKKYETPSHPWIKSRIEEEKAYEKQFGTRSKKEIWKAETLLKKFKSQAKKLIALSGSQVEVETQHLYRRVKELGLAKGDVTFDVILGLTVSDVLERRLQSVLLKKGLARSPNQARQFIVHGHVLVNGIKITSPSHLITVKDEASVSFAVSSSLFSEDHPERASKERLEELSTKKKEVEKEAASSNEEVAKEESSEESPADEESSEEKGDEQ